MIPRTDAHDLSCLLAPRAVAVVGASRAPDSLGHQVLANLLAHGFTGAVYPVNPNHNAICSVRAYPSVSSVSDPLDMAVVVVPKDRVLGVAEDCGKARVKALVVISAGFKETGAEGAAREHALMEVVRRYGMRMVGPKTDVGGVRVGITGEDQARVAYREILSRVQGAHPGAQVSGVLVQGMVAHGAETIIGMARDPEFGVLLMFGLGGIFVEVLGDVVFRIAPIDDAQAAEMVASIRGGKMLDGVRGAPAVNRRALVDALRRVAQLALDHPAILELDVNPLLAFPDGAIAVDARVRIA